MLSVKYWFRNSVGVCPANAAYFATANGMETLTLFRSSPFSQVADDVDVPSNFLRRVLRVESARRRTVGFEPKVPPTTPEVVPL